MKIGGEYLYTVTDVYFCNQCQGIYDAQGGPIPANLEQMFPNPMDVTTWNFAALSPLIRSYRIGVGNFDTHNPRHVSAFWFQDDWTTSSRMTLNLGSPLRPGHRILGQPVCHPAIPGGGPS